jgi:hypothetical protein
MERKLRVGLLLDRLQVSAWAYRMFERIQRSNYAEIVLVVVNALPEPAEPSLTERLRSKARQLPAVVAGRVLDGLLDHVTSGHYSIDAFVRHELQALLPETPVLPVVPVRDRYFDTFADADIEAIGAQRPDVLFRLGFGILKGRILTAAPQGIWSYHHGDNLVNRGGPAGYWEFLQGSAETGVILQILSEDLDNGTVLARTWSATDDENFPGSKSRTYWNASSMVPRQLERLHRIGAEAFRAEVAARNRDPVLYSNRLYRKPKGRELAGLLARKYAHKLHCKWNDRRFLEQWQLIFRHGEGLATELFRFRPIVPPMDRFWADPHVIARDGRHYVFIEELEYARDKGHISVMEIHADGSWSTPRPVIVEDFHLSYPHLVEHDGRLFMVPETYEAKSIRVYECVSFPDQWKYIGNIIDDIVAVDATFVRYDGLWYLFAGVKEVNGASASDELFVYSSERFPDGPWRPHPLNPVISDVRRARPAGAIITHQGQLYRPSQYCGRRYGYGLNLNRIDVLTPEDYRETTVTTAFPNWRSDLRGIHTLAYGDGLTVADVLVRRPRRR